MASRQDPTAADIAYAQYSAAEKTRMVGGVELILPRAMFRGARAGCVEDERGCVFRLADPVTLHFPGAEPPWYAQSLVFVVHGCTADGIGAFLRAL